MPRQATTCLDTASRGVGKAERVARHLRRRILDGTYPLNVRLPSARQLSRDLSLSQVTVLRGLKHHFQIPRELMSKRMCIIIKWKLYITYCYTG